MCHWLGYIHAKLGFWGSVMLSDADFAFGGEPFLPVTVRAQGEPDKAEIVNVLLQGIIPVVFIQRRCFIKVSQPEMLYLKAAGVMKGEEDLGLKLLAAWSVL